MSSAAVCRGLVDLFMPDLNNSTSLRAGPRRATASTSTAPGRRRRVNVRRRQPMPIDQPSPCEYLRALARRASGPAGSEGARAGAACAAARSCTNGGLRLTQPRFGVGVCQSRCRAPIHRALRGQIGPPPNSVAHACRGEQSTNRSLCSSARTASRSCADSAPGERRRPRHVKRRGGGHPDL